MKSTEQKINNVIGQLEGIKKMLDDDRTCVDILTQLKASKSAVSSLMASFVEENVVANLEKVCPTQNKELTKLIKELSR